MPENKDKSQDRQTAAPKKPAGPRKGKSANREARLAEALRANLRRRKASGSGAAGNETKEE